MKLQKALKLKKSLVGDITKLKEDIKSKNSYLVGNKNAEEFNVLDAYQELLKKINELTLLKYAINEANRQIQSLIYTLGEYKALIAFWNEVSVADGNQMKNDYSDSIREYSVHLGEKYRNELTKEFQLKVDAIQEEIDIYNYNTEILLEAPETVITDN